MMRVGRRWGVAVALALVPSLMTLPSHATTDTAPTPEPSTSATTEPVETAPPAEPAPTPTASPEQTAPAPERSAAPRTATAPPATSKRTAQAATKRWVSIQVNSGHDTRVLTRENFWLRGRVLTTKGKPQARAKVKIYRYSGKRKTRVKTLRTSKTGWYSWSPAKPRSGVYRAVVSTTRSSAKIRVKRHTGTRTLASREKSMGFLLGKPTSGVRRAGDVAWRNYARATLVQRGSRTWLVRGKHLSTYRSHAGAKGRLGAPTGDVRCGLPEGGCLQQFRTGAIYVNKKAKKKVTVAVSPKLGAADLVAVAKSQVGYREKTPRQSKYNRWIGETDPPDAWCGYFVSWLAHAAGKPGAVLKSKSFPALVKAERKRGRTAKTPRVGRLAYIGYFEKGKPTHVGIVSKVKGDHVWTVEGNVSAGGGSRIPRGVHVVKRHTSRIVFYADPKY
ncbi:CHAP domain-containing protein [Aeromicrobium flavum]|uniref:CHAP domain-containing protein n=1 Tax=Aeromicrobium flavum TaxID=416568 RepID=UPI0011BD5356|nr:CHAP domain-containing protein [Aeromicrobium flavum]